MRIVLLFAAIFLAVHPVTAHEMNTAYLELREQADGSVSVLTRVPEFGNVFSIQFAPRGKMLSDPVECSVAGGTVHTWWIKLPGGLENQRIEIDGLTMNDLLARVQLADGSEQIFRLTPLDESFTIKEAASQLAVAGTYFILGLDHILEGLDHLLFVLALLILVKGWKKLTGAITTFTVAHSITLALASLGMVHVPAPPVEAIIALSIVFVACEIIHSRQGRPGVTEKSPWLVTLTFGLLHGLGFAGALSEIGLPVQAIPIALLFFNVGVEAGQLLFVFAVLLILVLCRRLKLSMPHWFQWVPPYIIGSIAVFWVAERVSGF